MVYKKLKKQTNKQTKQKNAFLSFKFFEYHVLGTSLNINIYFSWIS